MNTISRLPHLPRPLAAIGGVLLVGALAACVSPQQEATPAEAVVPAEPVAPAEPPAPPAKDIWTAAAEGDLAALEAHKVAGTDLDSLQMEAGVTPLLITMIVGAQEAAEWLTANGADVNAVMRDGGNALHGAAFVGNSPGAALLLELGVDADALNYEGNSVWDILALDWGTTEYVSSLLDLGLVQEEVEAGRAEIAAMLGGGEGGGGGDIWAALQAGDAAALRAALAAGADANAVSPDGAAALLVASLNSDPELATALLGAGADVNAANESNGATPLHAAAFLGHADVARVLLDGGADANAVTFDGQSAMQMTELDWPTTEYLAGMLQLAVEEEAVMSGRAKIAEMLAQ